MSVGGMQLLVILVVLAVLFGASRLPKLARSLGQAARELREGLNAMSDSDDRGSGTQSRPQG